MVLVSLFLGALAMIIGVAPRAATALVWFAHSWLWVSNSSYYWSWGLLFSDFLFFLIFFASESRTSTSRACAGFSFRMFQVQVCFVYLLSCLHRYDSRAWLHGEAFHIAMADTVFGRFTFLDWYSYYPFTAPLAYGAWAVESMAGLFLLFHKRLGPYVVLALTGVHLSLELITMVQSWQFLMMASLIAFWPEAWLAGVEARMLHRTSRASKESPRPWSMRTKNMHVIVFITLWVTVFVVNVPVEWGRRYIIVSRKLLFPIHAVFGLGGSYGMRMFSRPDRRGNMCMIALGFRDGGAVSELLFEPPIKDCFNPGFRSLQNNVHHAFFKYYAMLARPGTPYRVYRKGKSPEEFQTDLGDTFCERARV